MNLVVQAAALIIALGVQVALVPSVLHRAVPAIVLVVVVSWGYVGRPDAGLRVAFFGGLLMDLYSQTHFGMFTVATTLAYAVTLLLRPPDKEASFGLRLSGMFLAAVVYHLVLLLWLATVTRHLPFWELLARTATLDVAATLLIFMVGQVILSLRRRPSPRYVRPF